MKYRDLIARLEDAGCVFVRHGHKHDFYRNVITGQLQPVPRHREVNEKTALAILKKMTAPES